MDQLTEEQIAVIVMLSILGSLIAFAYIEKMWQSMREHREEARK